MMKFNPNCSKETLQTWLNNTGDRSTYFDTRDANEGDIKADGEITRRQIEMINDWLKAHNKTKEE